MGTRFASYALWWIRRAVVAALSQQGCLVQIPRGRRRIRRLCRDVMDRLSNSLGRPPTPHEVADVTGLPLAEVARAAAAPAVTTLDHAPDQPGPQIHDPRTEDPDRRLLGREERERIRACVRTLPSLEAEIVRLHYGFGGRAPLTLREIGRELDLPDRRTDRLLRAALGRLGLMLRADEQPAAAMAG
jgi:RNA polymerase primary sigma factor